MTNNMTSGSPLKHLLRFAFPVWLGILCQQMYNIADTMIVGRYLGLNQLAGVGATAFFMNLVIWFFGGMCNGFCIPVAQNFGGGRDHMVRRYLSAGIRLALMITLVGVTVMAILAGPILQAMGTPDEIFPYARDYILVIILGVPFTMIYNYSASCIRSLGDSKTPFRMLVLSSVLNIVLDLVFILYLGLGVRGAALATVIAQATAGLTCLAHIYRNLPILHIDRNSWQESRSLLKETLRYGLPMGIRSSIIAAGAAILQVAVNSMGTNAIAGMTASGKLYGILSSPIMAVNQAVSPFAGQNIGARRLDRVSQGLRAAILLDLCVTGIDLILSVFFGRTFIGLFIENPPQEVIELGYLANMINVIGFSVLGPATCIPGIIQGMGYPMVSLVTGMTEVLGRAFACYILAGPFGFTGVCCANALAWIFTALFAIPAYLVCRKQLQKKFNAEMNT